MAERYGVSDEEIEAITHRNAMDLYQFDPFPLRSRERCTVGALRSEVAGHDVSIRSFGAGRYEHSIPNVGDLAARATG